LTGPSMFRAWREPLVLLELRLQRCLVNVDGADHKARTMKFVRLPTEIIVHFADYLTEGDVSRLLRVNWHVHSLLSDYLLKRNARRNSLRALAWATKQARRSVARRLIHYGADVNRRLRARHEKLNESTLLHFATLTKCQPMVNLLLELGADPSLTDSEGRTAVYWAYKNKDEKVIQSVTAKIVDLHKFLVHHNHHLTPLHMACSVGLTALVYEYVDMGLDVSAQDHCGKSALDYARSFLAHHYLATTSDSDSIVQWTRMLVMLGEDTATAHDHVSRHISSNELPNHRRQEGGHIQVGRRWCERTIGLSPTLGDASISDIPDTADFPSLSRALDQAPSLSLTTQNVWSPAKLARSVVKHSHAFNVEFLSTSTPTSDPFPSLTNSYKAVSLNEPSVMAWTTFREPSTQHDNVVEEVVPRLKQGKRRWQSLQW
jgi:Ankyrin repeats (3 copies)